MTGIAPDTLRPVATSTPSEPAYAPKGVGHSAAMALTDLAEFRIWVAWQSELKRDGKPTKIPYSARGRRAKSNDPATWGTRAAAVTWETQLPKPLGAGGVGVMFAPLPGGLHLGGVDLDTCRDPETGGLEPWAEEIVNRLNSYTEISPSRTGVKIFFTYDPNIASGIRQSVKFDRGKGNHPPAIELYLAGRYFTVTDQQVNGSSVLRTIPLEDLKWVVNVAGPAFKREPVRHEERGIGRLGGGLRVAPVRLSRSERRRAHRLGPAGGAAGVDRRQQPVPAACGRIRLRGTALPRAGALAQPH
jgi:hypothetical protein